MSWPETLDRIQDGQYVPLTIEEQAEQIACQLDLWGKPRGAVTAVMPTIQQLWVEILELSANDQPRLLVCWVGETSRGGNQMSHKLHRVDRNWLVVILRGKGFAAYDEAGKTLAPAEGMIAFSTVCETIRDRIRVITSISEENPLTYTSMKPLPNPAGTNVKSMFVDGMSIEFTTANDLQAVDIT